MMHVNTAVSGNAFVPVPIEAVGQYEAPYNEVNTNGFIDFTLLNEVYMTNYSSIYNSENIGKVPDISENITIQAFGNAPENRVMYDNPFKIPEEALKEFNNYSKIQPMGMSQIIDEYAVDEGGKKIGKAGFITSAVVRSLFNPYLSINVKGIIDNIPLRNSYDHKEEPTTIYNDLAVADTSDGSSFENVEEEIQVKQWENKDLYDTSDCSIRTLVRLSNEKREGTNYSKLGRAIYRYADFMYCKDLGKVSNNYLITLRRFPIPVGDNIFTVIGNEYLGNGEESDYKDINMTPDVGRLVAWLGDENKLEDILKFSFKDSWREYKGEFHDQDSQEDDSARGPLGSILNLANPNYRSAIAKGTAGSGNSILQNLGAASPAIGTFNTLSANGTYESNPVVLGKRYDENKVYEPKGTIRDTHQYEGKMTFTHDFTLTFNYELRAYEDINPKSAFLDLIGNILKVTYRTGTWWGGENRIFGAPGNKAGWKKAMALIDKGTAGAKDFANDFFSGNFDANAFFGKFGNFMKNFAPKNLSLQGVMDALNGNESGDGGEDKNAGVKKAVSAGIDVLSGMFKNAMGRPAVYALQSILDGSPVGLWHVTIGNPRNPIVAMGNLIIDNTSIQQYGPLGIDDFPTGIKVVVNLKHAKSRDASEIANMYTKGIGMINMKPKIDEFIKYYHKDDLFKFFGTESEKMLEKAFAN